MTKKTTFYRLVAQILIVSYLGTVYTPLSREAYAQNTSAGLIAPKSLPRDFDKIKIPAFGQLKDSFTGNAAQSILLIEDAHEIPEAQRNIEKLIEYLRSTYGVRSVMLEGASEQLDSQIFRSFPDQKRLREVFEDYYERGELTGGTAAAIFSNVVSRESSVVSKTQDSRPKTDDLVFEGIENWHLYEEGLGLYQEAMLSEAKLLKVISDQWSVIREEKKKVYSKELLEIDQAMEKFYENKSDLIETLKVLAKFEAPSGELALILKKTTDHRPQSTALEIKRASKEVERLLRRPAPGGTSRNDVIAIPPWREKRSHDSRLATYDLADFQLKKQAYQTSQISLEAYALYLTELAKKLGTDLNLRSVPGLLKAAEEERRLQNIQGTKLFKEFEEYVDQVVSRESSVVSFKNPRPTTQDTRQLIRKTKELRLLSKLIKLELTREEWLEVKRLKSEKVKKLEIEKLLTFEHFNFSTHFSFYENAEEREKAFLKNLEKKYSIQGTAYSELKRSTHDASRSTIIVAGGFHTEGLTSMLKSKNISYAVITPSISHLPSENFYSEHMKGNVSWKKYFEVKDGKVNLYEAFVRATRDKLVQSTAYGVQSEKNAVRSTHPAVLKDWRDQIIRDLAATNKIERAGSYTRFIDELRDGSGVSADVDLSSGEPSLGGVGSMLRSKWLSNIEKFIAGLRGLRDAHYLSEENILRVLKTPTISARFVNPSVMVQGSQVAGQMMTVRSELRAPSYSRRTFLKRTALGALSIPQLLSPLAQETKAGFDEEKDPRWQAWSKQPWNVQVKPELEEMKIYLSAATEWLIQQKPSESKHLATYRKKLKNAVSKPNTSIFNSQMSLAKERKRGKKDVDIYINPPVLAQMIATVQSRQDFIIKMGALIYREAAGAEAIQIDSDPQFSNLRSDQTGNILIEGIRMLGRAQRSYLEKNPRPKSTGDVFTASLDDPDFSKYLIDNELLFQKFFIELSALETYEEKSLAQFLHEAVDRGWIRVSDIRLNPYLQGYFTAVNEQAVFQHGYPFLIQLLMRSFQEEDRVYQSTGNYQKSRETLAMFFLLLRGALIWKASKGKDGIDPVILSVIYQPISLDTPQAQALVNSKTLKWAIDLLWPKIQPQLKRFDQSLSTKPYQLTPEQVDVLKKEKLISSEPRSEIRSNVNDEREEKIRLYQDLRELNAQMKKAKSARRRNRLEERRKYVASALIWKEIENKELASILIYYVNLEEPRDIQTLILEGVHTRKIFEIVQRLSRTKSSTVIETFLAQSGGEAAPSAQRISESITKELMAQAGREPERFSLFASSEITDPSSMARQNWNEFVQARRESDQKRSEKKWDADLTKTSAQVESSAKRIVGELKPLLPKLNGIVNQVIKQAGLLKKDRGENQFVFKSMRVKKPKSATSKVERLQSSSLGNSLADTYDLMGARIVVNDLTDLENVAKTIERLYPASGSKYKPRILKKVNKFTASVSATNPYRGLHYYITFPGKAGREHVFELQVIPIDILIAAQISHSVVYKKLIPVSAELNQTIQNFFWHVTEALLAQYAASHNQDMERFNDEYAKRSGAASKAVAANDYTRISAENPEGDYDFAVQEAIKSRDFNGFFDLVLSKFDSSEEGSRTIVATKSIWMRFYRWMNAAVNEQELFIRGRLQRDRSDIFKKLTRAAHDQGYWRNNQKTVVDPDSLSLGWAIPSAAGEILRAHSPEGWNHYENRFENFQWSNNKLAVWDLRLNQLDEAALKDFLRACNKNPDSLKAIHLIQMLGELKAHSPQVVERIANLGQEGEAKREERIAASIAEINVSREKIESYEELLQTKVINLYHAAFDELVAQAGKINSRAASDRWIRAIYSNQIRAIAVSSILTEIGGVDRNGKPRDLSKVVADANGVPHTLREALVHFAWAMVLQYNNEYAFDGTDEQGNRSLDEKRSKDPRVSLPFDQYINDPRFQVHHKNDRAVDGAIMDEIVSLHLQDINHLLQAVDVHPVSMARLLESRRIIAEKYLLQRISNRKVAEQLAYLLRVKISWSRSKLLETSGGAPGEEKKRIQFSLAKEHPEKISEYIYSSRHIKALVDKINQTVFVGEESSYYTQAKALLPFGRPSEVGEGVQRRSEIRSSSIKPKPLISKLVAPLHQDKRDLPVKTLAIAGVLGEVSGRYVPSISKLGNKYPTKLVGIDLPDRSILPSRQYSLYSDNYFVSSEFWKVVDERKIKPDGILILTRPDSHLEYVREALKREVPVFIEKPLVLPDQVDELEKLYAAYPRKIFAIDHVFDRASFLEAQNSAVSDSLGELESVEGKLNQTEILENSRAWIVDPKISGGGMAMDAMTHLIAPLELLLRNFGVSFESFQVNAEDIQFARYLRAPPGAETFANVRGILSFKSGTQKIRVNLEVGKGLSKNERYITLKGTKGRLRIDFKLNHGGRTRLQYRDAAGRLKWSRSFPESEAGQTNISLKILNVLQDSGQVSQEEMDARFQASMVAIRVIDHAQKTFRKSGKKVSTHAIGAYPLRSEVRIRSQSLTAQVLKSLGVAAITIAGLWAQHHFFKSTSILVFVATVFITRLLGQFAASFINRDHSKRLFFYTLLRDVFPSLIIPLYITHWIPALPHSGIFSHWLQPFADLFVITQLHMIYSAIVMGYYNTPRERKAGWELFKHLSRMKLTQVYKKEGLFRIVNLFWMPITTSLYSFVGSADAMRLFLTINMVVFQIFYSLYIWDPGTNGEETPSSRLVEWLQKNVMRYWWIANIGIMTWMFGATWQHFFIFAGNTFAAYFLIRFVLEPLFHKSFLTRPNWPLAADPVARSEIRNANRLKLQVGGLREDQNLNATLSRFEKRSEVRKVLKLSKKYQKMIKIIKNHFWQNEKFHIPIRLQTQKGIKRFEKEHIDITFEQIKKNVKRLKRDPFLKKCLTATVMQAERRRHAAFILRLLGLPDQDSHTKISWRTFRKRLKELSAADFLGEARLVQIIENDPGFLDEIQFWRAPISKNFFKSWLSVWGWKRFLTHIDQHPRHFSGVLKAYRLWTKNHDNALSNLQISSIFTKEHLTEMFFLSPGNFLFGIGNLMRFGIKDFLEKIKKRPTLRKNIEFAWLWGRLGVVLEGLQDEKDILTTSLNFLNALESESDVEVRNLLSEDSSKLASTVERLAPFAEAYLRRNALDSRLGFLRKRNAHSVKRSQVKQRQKNHLREDQWIRQHLISVALMMYQKLLWKMPPERFSYAFFHMLTATRGQSPDNSHYSHFAFNQQVIVRRDTKFQTEGFFAHELGHHYLYAYFDPKVGDWSTHENMSSLNELGADLFALAFLQKFYGDKAVENYLSGTHFDHLDKQMVRYKKSRIQIQKWVQESSAAAIDWDRTLYQFMEKIEKRFRGKEPLYGSFDFDDFTRAIVSKSSLSVRAEVRRPGDRLRAKNIATLQRNLDPQNQYQNWPEIYDQLTHFMNRGVQGVIPSGQVIDIEEVKIEENKPGYISEKNPTGNFVRIDTKLRKVTIRWGNKKEVLFIRMGRDRRLTSVTLSNGKNLPDYLREVIGIQVKPGLLKLNTPHSRRWEAEVGISVIQDPKNKNKLKLSKPDRYARIALEPNGKVHSFSISPYGVPMKKLLSRRSMTESEREEEELVFARRIIRNSRRTILETHLHPRSAKHSDDFSAGDYASLARLSHVKGLTPEELKEALHLRPQMVFSYDPKKRMLVGKGMVLRLTSNSETERGYEADAFEIRHPISRIRSEVRDAKLKDDALRNLPEADQNRNVAFSRSEKRSEVREEERFEIGKVELIHPERVSGKRIKKVVFDWEGVIQDSAKVIDALEGKMLAKIIYGENPTTAQLSNVTQYVEDNHQISLPGLFQWAVDQREVTERKNPEWSDFVPAYVSDLKTVFSQAEGEWKQTMPLILGIEDLLTRLDKDHPNITRYVATNLLEEVKVAQAQATGLDRFFKSENIFGAESNRNLWTSERPYSKAEVVRHLMEDGTQADEIVFLEDNVENLSRVKDGTNVITIAVAANPEKLAAHRASDKADIIIHGDFSKAEEFLSLLFSSRSEVRAVKDNEMTLELYQRKVRGQEEQAQAMELPVLAASKRLALDNNFDIQVLLLQRLPHSQRIQVVIRGPELVKKGENAVPARLDITQTARKYGIGFAAIGEWLLEWIKPKEWGVVWSMEHEISEEFDSTEQGLTNLAQQFLTYAHNILLYLDPVRYQWNNPDQSAIDSHVTSVIEDAHTSFLSWKLFEKWVQDINQRKVFGDIKIQLKARYDLKRNDHYKINKRKRTITVVANPYFNLLNNMTIEIRLALIELGVADAEKVIKLFDQEIRLLWRKITASTPDYPGAGNWRVSHLLMGDSSVYVHLMGKNNRTSRFGVTVYPGEKSRQLKRGTGLRFQLQTGPDVIAETVQRVVQAIVDGKDGFFENLNPEKVIGSSLPANIKLLNDSNVPRKSPSRKNKRSEVRQLAQKISRELKTGNVSVATARQIKVQNVDEVIQILESILEGARSHNQLSDLAPFDANYVTNAIQIMDELVRFVAAQSQHKKGARVALSFSKTGSNKRLAEQHGEAVSKMRGLIDAVIAENHLPDLVQGAYQRAGFTRSEITLVRNLNQLPLEEGEVVASIQTEAAPQNRIFKNAVMPVVTDWGGYDSSADEFAWYTEQVNVMLGYAVAILASQNLKPQDLKSNALSKKLLDLLRLFSDRADSLIRFQDGRAVTVISQVQSFIASYRSELRVKQSA